jgi:multiple sugar transport system substrate-binding protein
VSNDLLVDLAPYLRRDRLDTSIYTPGLLDVWGRDGRQFGMPKDWDTVALLVNIDLARKAGITMEQLRNMDWNPKDGGSFEQVMRRLTIDAAGNDASSPRFDPRHVAVHGFQTAGAGGMIGQTEWSHFAVSNGFGYQDKPWSGKFHYDDPRLVDTIAWIAGLPARGLSASYQDSKGLGADGMFVAGRTAMIAEGSWMIDYFARAAKFQYAWLPLPRGPSGQRATMRNSLADSIWVGSRVKDEAWKWVRYMASPDCQRVVAGYGVVFPSIEGLPAQSVAAQRKRGIDSSAFLQMSREHTFLTPIADNSAQIDALMKNAIESVLMGQQTAPVALKEANDRINRLSR